MNKVINILFYFIITILISGCSSLLYNKEDYSIIESNHNKLKEEQEKTFQKKVNELKNGNNTDYYKNINEYN